MNSTNQKYVNNIISTECSFRESIVYIQRVVALSSQVFVYWNTAQHPLVLTIHVQDPIHSHVHVCMYNQYVYWLKYGKHW